VARDSLPDIVRTRRFTRGAPRSFVVAADGSRVVFLRSRSGTDAQNLLWVFDVDQAEERLVTAARELVEGDLPAEERARRERAREADSGVVSFATDRNARVATFALSGELRVADLDSGEVVRRPTEGEVVDPRPDPTGARVAYVSGG
jgi:dipeptidyl-peptidase 4